MNTDTPLSVVDVPIPNSEAVAVAFFVGFFAVTLLALGLYRHTAVRRLYVGTFLVGLLVVSVTSPHLFPLNDLHKFSWTPGEEVEFYQTYVVDEDGDRLYLDRRVVPTYAPPPPPYATTGSMLATGCSDREATYVGRYLLDEAREYRERRADGDADLLEWVDFPRHHVENQWTRERLRQYGRFTELAVYRVTLTFESESYEIRSRNSTRVLTVAAPDAERGASNRPVAGRNATTSEWNSAIPERNATVSGWNPTIPEWVDCVPDD